MNPVEIAALDVLDLFVVNAALGAFGGEQIDVILGGYHLAGEGMEPRIEPTVHDLASRIRPRVVAPGALYRLACQGGARAYLCAGKLWA